MYNLLWTYVLISTWYILGVKFLGHHINFYLDGCKILLTIMPTTWCQSPNLGMRPYSFSQSRNIHVKNLLRKFRQSPIVFKVKSSPPGLAFKTSHDSISTFFAHVSFLLFPWCFLRADNLASLILSSCKTAQRIPDFVTDAVPGSQWNSKMFAKWVVNAHHVEFTPLTADPRSCLWCHCCSHSTFLESRRLNQVRFFWMFRFTWEFYQIHWIRKYHMAHATDLPKTGGWVTSIMERAQE